MADGDQRQTFQNGRAVFHGERQKATKGGRRQATAGNATDITADGHGMADGANAGVLAGFSPSLDIGKAKGKRLAERQAEGQTVTAWRERRQINRPDDDGRHMTDGHGGRSGHDGRDSRGTPAQATTEKNTRFFGGGLVSCLPRERLAY